MGFIISIAIAYILGSLNSAVIVSKLFKLPDPRKSGSKNAGATNVLRTHGQKPAIYVLIADVLKGFISILIALFIFKISGVMLGLVALAAVIGHIFPVFFKFQGGRGVATAMGCILVLSFWVTIFLIIIWVVIVYLTKYVSLASMIAAIAAPFIMLVTGHANYFFPLLLIAAVIIWRHKDNIDKLRKGTENKIKI